MFGGSRREFLFTSRDLLAGYRCRLPRLFSIKRYMIVGLFLIGFYFIQYLYGLEWSVLAKWQTDVVYKQVSGYLLMFLFLYQWQLSRLRNLGLPDKQHITLKSHKWLGAVLPLPLFLHAMQPGYGYLYLLAIFFLACIASGLFNVETVRLRCKACLFVWTLLHIILAMGSVFLLMFHIYFVYTYS